MNKVWIACDWHLWNRKNNYSHPYRSISSIGKLSDNYTSGISSTDIFVHLGDIADPEKADKEKLKAIIQSIPAGYKVLCKGNHDTEPDDYYYSLGFDTVCEICTLYNVVLSHFPVKVNEDEVNVHAHLHSEKLSSLGYQHINAYKANFNDGPTSLDDLLDTAIFQDEAEYKSTDMMHYEKKFTEYTSAMFGNRFTQIVDISDKVPLAPIEESAKPQLDDSDADTILNEILFDDVEDTQYWMADDDAYHDTVRKAEDNQTTSMVTIAETVDVSEYADIYTSRITELTDNANQDESMFKHISKLTHVPVEQLPKFSPKLTVKTDKQLCFEMLPSNIPWKIRVEYERFLLKIIKKLNKTKADLPYTGTIWTADGDCLLYVNLNDTPMNEMYLSSLSATGAHAEEILNDDTESLKEMTPEEKKKIANKYGLKSTGVYREKDTEANKTAEDRKKERDQKRLENLEKARKIHKRNSRIRRIKKKIPFIKNESMGDTAVDTDINSLYDQPPTEQGGLFDGQIRYFHGLYDSEAYVETAMTESATFTDVKHIIDNIPKGEHHWFYHGNSFKDSPYVKYRNIIYTDKKNKIGGFIDIYAFDDAPDTGIVVVAVDPRARGKGIASRLVKTAIKELPKKGINTLIWRADNDNIASIKLAEKLGFSDISSKDNPDQRKFIYYIDSQVKSTNDSTFDKIIALNKKLNTFTYGLNKPGQTRKIKKQNTTNDDYDNYYHMASPEQFIKQEGGICWDFATYEASVFSKDFSDISYETYYIVFDIKPDYPNHTFLVFRYKGKYCFFESSFKRLQGIWMSDKLSDIFNFILHEMGTMHNGRLMPYILKNEYRIFKYNALNHRLYGQRAGRYMDIVESEGIIIKHRYSDDYDVINYNDQKSIQESYQFELLDTVKFIEPLQESVEEYKDEPLYPVYIMLIHSGSALANAIKFATQSNFSHSSISFDATMTNMYSFGRKADTNPFAGGFKKESIKSQFYTSRTIPYALYMVACTKSQVDQMKKRLNYFIKNSSKFKYDFTGLFKNYFGIADNPEYQWFCSRFVADILNAGRPSEHPYVVEPSLMKPEDFMHTTYAHYVTGGVLSNYDVKAVEKKVRTMLKLERMNRMLEAQKMAVNEASNMLDESVKAHTETLYRVTYHGIGIYEAFKKACSFDEWKAFKDSDAATWLDVPTVYNHDIDHASYFTKKGYDAFKKNTYPVMIQKLNKNDIKVDKVSVDTKPVYTDRYQVVIPTAISESVVFDLDPFNPFQSATLKYQLSQMDESATEQFLDYIRSFKIRIDKNGNIRVTRREYDQLDQHFKRSVRITKAAVKAGNTAMVKDELCKVYYMVSLIDNHYSKLPPVTTDPKQKQVRKDLLDLRSVMLNMFNQNLKYVTVAEPNFNFNSYYASSKYGKDVMIPKQIVTAVGKTIITLL